MPLLTILTLVSAVQLGAPQETQRPPEPAATTLTGCIQQTGDPNVFLLAVPGIAPPLDVAAAGSGRSSTPNVGSAEDPSVSAGARVPAAGDAARPAPTLENRSYKLADIDSARLKPLIGHAVEVRGQLSPVEGKPPTNLIFHASDIKPVADSCTTLIRGK
jgi:hypothetical protein